MNPGPQPEDTLADLLQDLCEEYDLSPTQRISTLIDVVGDDELDPDHYEDE